MKLNEYIVAMVSLSINTLTWFLIFCQKKKKEDTIQTRGASRYKWGGMQQPGLYDDAYVG